MPGCRAVAHDGLGPVVTAGTVTALALDPVGAVELFQEAIGGLPGAGDVAAQTPGAILRGAFDAFASSHLQASRRAQHGVGPGVLAHAPSAELIAHFRALVAPGAAHHADVCIPADTLRFALFAILPLRHGPAR